MMDQNTNNKIIESINLYNRYNNNITLEFVEKELIDIKNYDVQTKDWYQKESYTYKLNLGESAYIRIGYENIRYSDINGDEGDQIIESEISFIDPDGGPYIQLNNFYIYINNEKTPLYRIETIEENYVGDNDNPENTPKSVILLKFGHFQTNENDKINHLFNLYWTKKNNEVKS